VDKHCWHQTEAIDSILRLDESFECELIRCFSCSWFAVFAVGGTMGFLRRWLKFLEHILLCKPWN
jgi:hypothetical protein